MCPTSDVGENPRSGRACRGNEPYESADVTIGRFHRPSGAPLDFRPSGMLVLDRSRMTATFATPFPMHRHSEHQSAPNVGLAFHSPQ
jgi:hypothetical protein